MTADVADGTTSDEQRFAVLFRELSPRVFAYARRQCDAADAHDVVADTFLVAWRRLADVPADPLPWLLVVARNTIANRTRGAARHGRRADAGARVHELAGPAPGVDHDVVERATLLDALTRLSDTEREALLLVAWDGLGSAAAAQVAGCTTRAFEARLSRARARLAREVAGTPDLRDTTRGRQR